MCVLASIHTYNTHIQTLFSPSTHPALLTSMDCPRFQRYSPPLAVAEANAAGWEGHHCASTT